MLMVLQGKIVDSNKIADVYILDAARTPIGSFGGSLASLSAVQLGSAAVSGVLQRTAIKSQEIDELYFGNVVSAGNGQNVARQVSLQAGLGNTTPCTSVNKVCASGMKAVALAAQSIRLGDVQVAVAGGTESMSNTPHLVHKARFGIKYGSAELMDSLANDGLTDAFGNCSMGTIAEETVKEYSLTRADQDTYAINSYTRARDASAKGYFSKEIVPVDVAAGKATQRVALDDQPQKFFPDKIPTLRPSFGAQGTITPASASPMSDGAAAVILVSGTKLQSLINEKRISSKQSIFKLLASSDAEKSPNEFTTAPSVAIPAALKKANLNISDIDYFEVNEAFACVALANMKILQVDPNKVNVHGGAVALGHPLGCSGARIIATLCNVLETYKGKIGCAGICNGGGGASACVIERVEVQGY